MISCQPTARISTPKFTSNMIRIVLVQGCRFLFCTMQRNNLLIIDIKILFPQNTYNVAVQKEQSEWRV